MKTHIKHEMPDGVRTDMNWLRNTMVTLDQFRSVRIEFEQNQELSDAYGEGTGEWRVAITAPSTSGRLNDFVSEGEDFEEVLYDAVTQAERSTDEWYDKCKAAREAALAKLTPEERRILSVA